MTTADSTFLPYQSPQAEIGPDRRVSSAPSPAEPIWTERGTAAYRRISLALFLVGFSTFSLIYAVQPLLPALAHDFGTSASASSLALSFCTAALAFSILCASVVSDRINRRSLMFASMASAALMHLGSAVAPTWHGMLLFRALEGLALGGVPAVAMAYLAEEIQPRALGAAMGLYVGGTAFGAMAGRVGTGFLAEFASWRVALGALGLVDLVAALGFLALLPTSRNVFPVAGRRLGEHGRLWRNHLRSPDLPLLFLVGFLVLGVNVTTFNYIGFRLARAPFDLGPSQISAVYGAFLLGTFASPLAGTMADRFGRSPVMLAGVIMMTIGLGFTLSSLLALVMLGMVLNTIGFFVVHAVASGWVGRLAAGAKAHASSLYLLSYYLGSSVLGSAGGWFWTEGGWSGVAAFNAVLLAALASLTVALSIVSRSARRPPEHR